jgi:hypothetical protein
MKIGFFKETDYEKLEMESNYEDMNEVRPCQYSHESFKSMLDSGFFKYSKGAIEHNKRRYFLCESSLMYILENELNKIPGSEKILFDIAFEYGQKVTSNENLNERFISNFMASIGFGDIYITQKNNKYMAVSNFFPWTKFYTEISFAIYRGILSGMLSTYEKKKIVLNKVETDVSNGHLSIIVSQ